MRIRAYIRYKGSVILIVLALLLFFISLLLNNFHTSPDNTARRLEKKIETRMDILENYAKEALASNTFEILQMPNLDKDMVIYKYVYDTLEVWKNQFPVKNDDISNILLFKNLTNISTHLNSPLSNVCSEIQYLNLGSKWYLVKAISNNIGEKIILGLEIQNTHIEDYEKSKNGINKHFNLDSRYNIYPISYSTGTPIYLNNTPTLKLQAESLTINSLEASSILRWLALLFFSIALVLYLRRNRSIKSYLLVTLYLIVLCYLSYWGGVKLKGLSDFFSPAIYADGKILFSIGMLTIYNIIIILFIWSTFSIRNILIKYIYQRNGIFYKILYLFIIAAALIILHIYIYLTLKSVILNSSISFELSRWNDISGYTILIYISYILLIFSGYLLVKTALSAIRENNSEQIFTSLSLIIFSLFCAAYLTLTTAIIGSKKEDNKISVWANRLSVDRDLSLEIRLRIIEKSIANDSNISHLIKHTNNDNIIRNRILENYLTQISQKYYIKVNLISNSTNSEINKLNNFILSGTPIATNSNFTHYIGPNNRSCYIGQFLYYSNKVGISHLVINLESKSNREYTGYQELVKSKVSLNEVSIPNFYSYGKYISNKLSTYNGTYSYPIIINEYVKLRLKNGERKFQQGGYIHYINPISTEEIVFISRKKNEGLSYFITFSYLILFTYALFLGSTNSSKKRFKRNYFRSRITLILSTSLFMAFIIMSTASVLFVNKRNEENLNNSMRAKILTIQKMAERHFINANSYEDISSNLYSKIIGEIASTLKSDISLFSADGKLFKTTAPEIFENSLLSSRINNDAYYMIKYSNQKFYLQKSKNDSFYQLYAPIHNSNNKLLAIISAPYSVESSTFNRDALFHVATIISLFLIFLAIVLFIGKAVINSLFDPLIIMGKKMLTASTQGLELIEYNREDEISSLVSAYNRMTEDLSKSTKQLAQAERDKAWSEMARQVAHEIKNPLTPIKLEIQRLIRLKERNDSRWSEKFDNVSKIILEHIDILTDTANEFSTFAKLYSEAPVLIDLDKILRDQIMIFDNRDNIEISYFGLNNSMVLAPKPQLIRVFVNLITNAIQAVETLADTETGGKILISLRNSTEDEYYDIVIEDNGSGVKDDNLSKLFTPNFTTKSGGTGLGLAICRNIIEKCKGTISYKRSHILSGACFTVHFPKNK